MDDKKYRHPQDLERAVRDAARRSGRDVSRTIDDFYAGRLMERVFSEESSAFVLKGGRGMLARMVDARYTRDTDFLYSGVDIDEALGELKRLASLDLGDFLTYRFESAVPIAEDQEYRRGYRVAFTPFLGGTKRLNVISIDLVVDEVPTGEVDLVTPTSRLPVRGLPTFDFRVYPIESTIADKVCATLERHQGGRPSSRVKDLADLVIIVTREEFDGTRLSARIAREAGARHLGLPDAFSVPAEWYGRYEKVYGKCAREANLAAELSDMAAAEELVGKCIDSVLAHEVEGRTWNPAERRWRPLEGTCE